MANSLLFDGVDIGSAVPMFRLIDVQVGGAGRDMRTLPSPIADGEYFAGAKNTPRTITAIFCLPDETERLSSRIHALRQINTLLSAKTPRVLRSPALGDGYYNAICTELPSVSQLDWTEELTATFVAYDPYFYSDFDDLNKALVSDGTTDIYINCSGSVRPTIKHTIAFALPDPSWVCSNGQSIMLQGDVAAGALVIDCERREITLNGASILAQLSLDSLFFEFSPNPEAGATPHTITCSNGAAGTITGKYRWL